LLFLDEPTNHLDIPAAEILEEALVGFEGTVILVSHDRRFLETVTTRTLAFTPDGIDTYEGGFKDYGDALERKRKADDDGQKRAQRNSAPPKPARDLATRGPSPAPAAKPAGRDVRKATSRDVEKKKKRVAELEKQVSDLESTLASFRDELKSQDHSNWQRVHELALQDRQYSELLERAMKEWVTLSEEVAQLSGAEAGDRK